MFLNIVYIEYVYVSVADDIRDVKINVKLLYLIILKTTVRI